MQRQGSLVPKTVNKKERTAEVCWSTGAKVLRSNILGKRYFEELSLQEGHVNLDRLNDGAAVLNSHRGGSLSDQIGVVEKAWLDEGKGFAKIRFSEREDVNPIFKDIEQGIIRNVSVGYRVNDAEELEEDGEIPTIRAVAWEPFEISLVPIPADKGGKVRSMEENQTDVLADERQRVSEIVGLCRKFEVPSKEEKAFIESGSSLDSVRSKILDMVGEKQNIIIKTSPVEITRDEKETKKEGMTEALLYRSTGAPLTDKGKPYAGMSLIDMARTSIGASYSDGKMDIAQRAFHSTSDFPEVLGNVAKQKLLRSYEALMEKQDFWPLCRVRSFADFKPVRSVRMGEKADLLPLPELSEYKGSTYSETTDQWAIETFGRKIGISRQMVINDDLGAFDSIGNWAGSISRLESKLFWSIFNDPNYKLNKVSLFDAKNHKNLLDGTLSIDTLSQARIAMAKQQGLDTREGDYLGLQAKYLIVPVEMQTKAEQFISREVVPQKPDEVNPFKGSFKVIATTWLKNPNEWYLAASPDQGIDLIEAGYLNGVRAPFVDYKTDFETDGMQVKVRYDVGFKAIDHRGLLKVKGA